MTKDTQKEERFNAVVSDHRTTLYKVCYMYAEDSEHFKDLWQEVLANVWQGLDSFRGEAKLSTWLYRTAINTCVTYFRRTSRHSQGRISLDALAEIPGDDSGQRTAQLKRMYSLIADLGKLDKAIILMWLDEKSYDEIAELTGLGRNAVATRLRRIKLKLAEKNSDH